MSLGVAMIARNGAALMVEALAPFLGKVDQVSVVLGGPSSDRTAQIARKYADVVGNYDGILGPDGLFDFSHARQQAFDQLDTDYAIVIDTDDIWAGVEHLGFVMDEAISRDSPAIMVRYNLPNSTLYQPRIFKRKVGHWRHMVHELFDYQSAHAPLMAGDLIISQNPAKQSRGRQNIVIGEYILANEPDNTRAMAHLARDYRIAGDNDKALDLCHRYLDLTKTGSRSASEYAMVLETKSEVEMLTHRTRESFLTAIEMLADSDSGTAWSTLAEASFKLSNTNEGLLKLAIMAADQALRSGRTRAGHAYKVQMSGSIPCLIKALAYHEMGQYQEALRATDLGLMLDPTNVYLQQAQLEAAQKLNEVV